MMSSGYSRLSPGPWMPSLLLPYLQPPLLGSVTRKSPHSQAPHCSWTEKLSSLSSLKVRNDNLSMPWPGAWSQPHPVQVLSVRLGWTPPRVLSRLQGLECAELSSLDSATSLGTGSHIYSARPEWNFPFGMWLIHPPIRLGQCAEGLEASSLSARSQNYGLHP